MKIFGADQTQINYFAEFSIEREKMKRENVTIKKVEQKDWNFVLLFDPLQLEKKLKTSDHKPIKIFSSTKKGEKNLQNFLISKYH